MLCFQRALAQPTGAPEPFTSPGKGWSGTRLQPLSPSLTESCSGSTLSQLGVRAVALPLSTWGWTAGLRRGVGRSLPSRGPALPKLYPYVPQRLCPHSSPTALLPRCPQEGKEDSEEVTKFQTVRRSQEVQSRVPSCQVRRLKPRGGACLRPQASADAQGRLLGRHSAPGGWETGGYRGWE